MRRLATLLVLLVALAGCSSAPEATAHPGPTDDAAIAACRADVLHANLNRHDVTALDFAIHDCPSLAALKAAVSAAPGYLDPGVTVDVFVRNRCDDPNAVFAGLDNPLCNEVPPLQ